MIYNQKMVDQFKSKMPSNVRMEIIRRTGLPQATVRDAFIKYRRAHNPAQQNLIYDTAIKVFKERGINIKQLK